MFKHYALPDGFFDEMFDNNNQVRRHYQGVWDLLSRMTVAQLKERQQSMLAEMVKQGITFTLYKDADREKSLERIIPFDIIPRIIPAGEWKEIERGLIQRVRAINLFLWDIYHEQRILQAGVIPRRMVVGNRYFRPEMMGMDVPYGVYIPFSGIDLIRDETGRYFVLEDNLRCPSGISYLYKNRLLMMKLFPELFFEYRVKNVDYGLNHFLSALSSLSPVQKPSPLVVLLTPGRYNSAYFEHVFLSKEMGIELAEGRDLKIIDHKVYLKNMNGFRQVDVIYRRVDDDFLDPVAFRPDSLLGVPGLMSAYRAGNVALANAPGTGVADDKAMYTFIPEMIHFYLQEEPVLHNIHTYILAKKADRDYVLEYLPEMVVKETSLSGGYGMLIGPHATAVELDEFRQKIKESPERYIAQPTIRLSSAPTLSEKGIVTRHIDLRPYVTMGKDDIQVIPGGLTRVALRQGSLVVNSSQGGGSKDTWVLAQEQISVE